MGIMYNSIYRSNDLTLSNESTKVEDANVDYH